MSRCHDIYLITFGPLFVFRFLLFHLFCLSDWGLYLIVLAALFFSFRILGAWVLTEKAKVFF